jgi:hypothetical protein
MESSDVVTWASAFWGLVAIALNSMSQPAGAVCGTDADVNFELRSSPIVCVMDSILIIWRFLYYLGNPLHQKHDSWMARIRTARMRLLRFRFQAELNGPSRTGDFADLIKNRHIRLLLYAFTLSQVVKLYGYSGIPWTKAFASLYLASFLVIELLVGWNRPTIDEIIQSTKEEEPIKASGPYSYPFISIAASVVLTLYLATIAAKDTFGQPGESILRWSGLVVPICGAAFCVPVYLYAAHNRERLQQIVLPGFLLILLVALPLFAYFIAPFAERGGLEIMWHGFLNFLMVTAWTGICLIFTSLATKTVRVQGYDQAKKRMERGAAVFFLVLNVVTAIMYYRFSYNPRDTHKSPWTEYLG